MEGDPEVTGNQAETGNNIYLRAGKKLIFTHEYTAFTGRLGVRIAAGTGIFTQDYGMSAVAPEAAGQYFPADEGYVAYYDSDEAVFREAPAEQEPVSFVEYSYLSGSGVRKTNRETSDYTILDANTTVLNNGWYVVPESTVISGRLSMADGTQNVHLIIPDGVTLDCRGGIRVPYCSGSFGSLNIYGGPNGSGKLIAKGTTDCAGIGGDDGECNGNITIHGIKVNATGGKNAAGIGGGHDGVETDSPRITIFGGSVTANGGSEGAGIGGGNEQKAAPIFIHGGTVTAVSPSLGAGIGGGDNGGTYGIKITGGTVYARGGKHGAGIGGGEDAGNVTLIEISDAHVEAYGGAGIGAGCEANMKGKIKVSGRVYIKAIGSDPGEGNDSTGAAGIGGGKGDFGGGDMKGTIIFDCTADSRIEAKGGNSKFFHSGAAIGGGYGGNMTGSVTIFNGSFHLEPGYGASAIGGGREDAAIGGEGGDVTIYDGHLEISWYSEESLGRAEVIGAGFADSKSGTLKLGNHLRVITDPWDGTTALRGDRISSCHSFNDGNDLIIAACSHDLFEYKPDTEQPNLYHIRACKNCATDIHEGHTDSGNGKCPCGYTFNGTEQTIVIFEQVGSDLDEDGQNVRCLLPWYASVGEMFTLPDYDETLGEPNGKRFIGWQRTDVTDTAIHNPGEEINVNKTLISFTAVYTALFRITVETPDHGLLFAGASQAAEGDEITVSAEADRGYELTAVTVNGVGIEPDTQGNYRFAMPAEDVVLSAEFALSPLQVHIRDDIDHGTVTVEEQTFTAGDTVILTVTPDSGCTVTRVTYMRISVYIQDEHGAGEEITPEDGVWSFVMPDESVIVDAEFTVNEFTVSFNGNGGGESMESFTVEADDVFTLPDCGFSTPQGMRFREWSVTIGSADPVSKAPTQPIIVSADTIVMAVWEDLPVLTVSGATGSFNDRIKLNFYFDIPDSVLADEGAYVTLTNETGGAVVTLPVGEGEYVQGKGRKFSIPLAAKEAGDTVTARVFDGDGNAMVILGGSGTDYTETGVQYTLMQYFTWLESHGTANEKKVGAAAKDYCSAAMIYFGCAAEGVSVSDKVDRVEAETLNAYKAGRDGTLPAGVSLKGITAMLESDNTLRLYLGFKNVDPAGFTYAIDGEAAELKQRADGVYYLAMDAGVWSNRLQDAHEYSISDGDSTYTVSTSVLTFARSCAVNDNEDARALGKALYLYNRAAVNAFGE